MISSHIVKLATDYLDQCTAKSGKATLVGMHWYIDGRDKSLPLLDEVNEALSLRPSVYVQRINDEVVFTHSGTERAITTDDIKLADKHYRKEFSIALKRLEK
jgi:hypothetical protein